MKLTVKDLYDRRITPTMINMGTSYKQAHDRTRKKNAVWARFKARHKVKV